jgi:hypothetical protein
MNKGHSNCEIPGEFLQNRTREKIWVMEHAFTMQVVRELLSLLFYLDIL